MRSSNTQFPCEAFKKEFEVPTAGRIHPKPPHILHGSPLKRKSATYGEMLGSIMRTTAISLSSQEFWKYAYTAALSPSVLFGMLTLEAQDHFHRRVAEAKRLVPNPLEVDGAPDTSCINLKVGTAVPHVAQRLTLKMAGQSSDALSKIDGQPSDVTPKNQCLGQEDITGAGIAVQEITRSPRGWSVGGHPDSARSSTTNTPSGSEKQQNNSMGAQGLLSLVTKATAPTVPTSQNPPNASFGVSSDVARHSSSASGTLSLVDILSLSGRLTRLVAFANFLLAHTLHQPYFGSSPMDSLLRRPGQGLTSTLFRVLPAN